MRRIVQACALVVLTATLAHAQSTTEVYVPIAGMLQNENNQTVGTADVLRCTDFVAAVGITDATKMFFRTGTSSVSGTPTMGIAIYNADGTTQLREGTVTYTTTNEDRSITGLTAFSLTAGTLYRLCHCASASSGSYRGVGATAVVLAGYLNAFTTHIGTAANSCASGDPPATTGSLSAATTFVPMLVKLGTDTP